jgi:hypothetical protein
MILRLHDVKIKGLVIYCSAREKMARRIELQERERLKGGGKGCMKGSERAIVMRN